MRFFVGMDSLMPGSTASGGKGFGTKRALERFLLCVGSLVFFLVALHRECFVAKVTFEWIYISVNFFVLPLLVLGFERFFTHGTYVRFIRLVRFFMTFQVTDVGELHDAE